MSPPSTEWETDPVSESFFLGIYISGGWTKPTNTVIVNKMLQLQLYKVEFSSELVSI
jgi:hypothetical protein